MITSWLLRLLYWHCRALWGSSCLIIICRLCLHFVKRYIPLDFLCWQDRRGVRLFWWTVCSNQILYVRMRNVPCILALWLTDCNVWQLFRLLLLDRFDYLLRTVSLNQLLNIRVSLFFCAFALQLLSALGLGCRLFLDRAMNLNQTMHIIVCDVLLHRSLRGRDLPLVRDTALPFHGPLLRHRVLILLSRPLGCIVSPKMRFYFWQGFSIWNCPWLVCREANRLFWVYSLYFLVYRVISERIAVGISSRRKMLRDSVCVGSWFEDTFSLIRWGLRLG